MAIWSAQYFISPKKRPFLIFLHWINFCFEKIEALGCSVGSSTNKEGFLQIYILSSVHPPNATTLPQRKKYDKSAAVSVVDDGLMGYQTEYLTTECCRFFLSEGFYFYKGTNFH